MEEVLKIAEQIKDINKKIEESSDEYQRLYTLANKELDYMEDLKAEVRKLWDHMKNVIANS